MTSGFPSTKYNALKRHKPRHAQQQKASHKPEPLPTNVKDLQAMVIALQQQVAQLTRMLFGRRSERVWPEDPAQSLLFGRIDPADELRVSPEGETSSEQDASGEDEEPAPKRRKSRHRGRRPLPAHLMRCIHDIHAPQEEQTCPSCSTAKTVFWRGRDRRAGDDSGEVLREPLRSP